MSKRSILRILFYVVVLTLAMVSGIYRGFTGTHTPPAPLGVEFICLIIAVVFWTSDARAGMPTLVHKLGIGINLLLVGYIIALAL